MCDLCACIANHENVVGEYLPDIYQFWFIMQCKTHHQWMLVLKRHSDKISISELDELCFIMDEHFHNSELRTQARSIVDHIHFHVVD